MEWTSKTYKFILFASFVKIYNTTSEIFTIANGVHYKQYNSPAPVLKIYFRLFYILFFLVDISSKLILIISYVHLQRFSSLHVCEINSALTASSYNHNILCSPSLDTSLIHTTSELSDFLLTNFTVKKRSNYKQNCVINNTYLFIYLPYRVL
jgi:hypothetical protein